MLLRTLQWVGKISNSLYQFKTPFKLFSLIMNSFDSNSTPSGPEVSLCMESLFGTDVDILSWYVIQDELDVLLFIVIDSLD